MATSGNRDVNLTIRAKNEASAGIKSVADALKQLDTVQNNVGSSAKDTAAKLDTLGKGLTGLEAISKKIGAATETASAAIQRQAQSLISTNQQISDRKARVEELTRALGILSTEADKAFIGPKRDGLTGQIKLVKSELKSAESSINTLTSNFDRQLAGLQQSRAAFREIQASQAEASNAIASFSAEIAQQTAAIEQNTAAAQRAKAAQQFFNNRFAPGLGRSTSADDQAEIAAVLRVAEARDREIQKLREEERATRELAQTQEAQRRAATLSTGNLANKSARDSAAVFQQADIAAAKAFEDQMASARKETKELDAAAAALRNQLNPLAAIEDNLAEEQAKLNRLFAAGRINAKELADGMTLLRGKADAAAKLLGTSGVGGKPTLFGLKPYELQNLSFQINDIFTQLASGTSLTQTLAQQGGQLLQIFPRVGSAIVAAFTNPVVLTFAATIGVVVLAMKEAADQAARVREFTGALAASADGSSYQATALAENVKQLERYGVATADATKLTKLFVKEGINPDRIADFSRTAKDMADVLGIDVVDAGQKLANAFTGGYEAIKQLDQQINFLSASQRDNIRAMFEQGQAAAANAEASRILRERYGEAAEKMRGPWTEAVRNLSNAWGGLLDRLANTSAIQTAVNALANLAKGATAAMNALDGVNDIGELDQRIRAKLRDYGHQLEMTARGKDIGGYVINQYQAKAGAPEAFNDRAAELNALLEERARLTLKIQAAEQKTAEAALAQKTEAAKKANQNLNEETDQLKAQNKLVSDKLRIEAAIAKARQDAEKTLTQDQFKAADEAAKAAYVAQQVAIARQKIEKQITEEHKSQAAELRRQNIAGITDNRTQDLIGTANRFVGQNETTNKASLQDLFKQAGVNIDPEMTAWCAAFVNAVLATNGIKGTGSLAARSFLGFGKDATSNPQEGDIVVLRRGQNQSQGHVGFFQGFDEQGNVKVLGGNQGNGVNTQTFKKNDVLGIRRPLTPGEVAQQELQAAEQLQKKQDAYNTSIDNQLDARKQDTAQLQAQNGLIGEALLAKQKEAAIEDAVRKATQDAEKAGVDTESEGFKKKIEDLKRLEGAYFDAAHAKDTLNAQRQAVDQPVSDLTSARDALQERITQLNTAGQTGLANQLTPQLDTVNAKLTEAIAKAKEFYASLSPEQAANLGLTAAAIDAIKVKLDSAAASGQQFGFVMGIAKTSIAQAFASSAVGAIDSFAQAIANGEKATTALKDAFLQFASQFLRQIATMILQQLIFNAISGALGLKLPGMHTGGIAGQDRTFTRTVAPAFFNGAVRYHTGGVAGLKPDEVPAILQRGEEVLTKGDPRHRANGGLEGGGAAPQVKIVNAFDAADMLQHALGSKVGEKALLNYVRGNSRTIKAALG